ncbi:MAG: TlpA family protein disulfide reductase [Fimbriimonadaceae bacterium]|jgi:peroxiredoxin|nr:TlpA family protein disulfide reductase [Fimbriimonadaceae bacterium]
MKNNPKALIFLSIGIMLTGTVAINILNANRPVVVTSEQPNLREVPRHPVTGEMKTDATARQGRLMPATVLPDQSGQEVDLAKLASQKPLVVVMVKEGCPCNIESQPFFNQIARAYGDQVQFIGIIDQERAGAAKFHSDFSVPYPILSAPKESTFQAWDAKQSVYTFLIGPKGEIEKVWPGYSRTTLVELSSLLAERLQIPTLEVDFKMAPDEMTSGCYFFRDDPAEGA